MPGRTWASHRHFCLLYPTSDVKDEAVRSFVAAGRDAGARIIYYGDPDAHRTPGADLLDWIAGEGVELRSIFGEDSLVSAEPGAMQSLYEAELSASIGAGYDTLWITADPTAALDEPGGTGRFIEHEHLATKMLDSLGVTALCSYDRRRLPADVEAGLARAHPDVIDGGQPWMRIVPGPPPGHFRVEGELDLAGHDAVVDSLAGVAEGVRINVDVSGVTFLDAGGAAALCAPARDGRPMTLRRPSVPVRRVLELTQFDMLPALTISEE